MLEQIAGDTVTPQLRDLTHNKKNAKQGPRCCTCHDLYPRCTIRHDIASKSSIPPLQSRDLEATHTEMLVPHATVVPQGLRDNTRHTPYDLTGLTVEPGGVVAPCAHHGNYLWSNTGAPSRDAPTKTYHRTLEKLSCKHKTCLPRIFFRAYSASMRTFGTCLLTCYLAYCSDNLTTMTEAFMTTSWPTDLPPINSFTPIDDFAQTPQELTGAWLFAVALLINTLQCSFACLMGLFPSTICTVVYVLVFTVGWTRGFHRSP